MREYKMVLKEGQVSGKGDFEVKWQGWVSEIEELANHIESPKLYRRMQAIRDELRRLVSEVAGEVYDV